MPIKKLCKQCGKVILIRKSFSLIRYCSKKCKRRRDYLNHKEKRVLSVMKYNSKHKQDYKIWHKRAMRKRKNNGKQNKAIMKCYEKNKDKWYSRNLTYKLLKNKSITLNKKCKSCNGLNHLQTHHEIYPINKLDIISAIANGRIYYLCFKCHRAKHKDLNNIKCI